MAEDCNSILLSKIPGSRNTSFLCDINYSSLVLYLKQIWDKVSRNKLFSDSMNFITQASCEISSKETSNTSYMLSYLSLLKLLPNATGRYSYCTSCHLNSLSSSLVSENKSANGDPSSFMNMFGNPYFAAGFGLIWVGVAAGFCRNMVLLMVRFARKQALCSLEIPSKDSSFLWVMQWLITKSKNTNQLGLETEYIKDASGFTSTSFNFIPAVGMHLVKYNKKYFVVTREREKTVVDLNSGCPWETLTITTISPNKYILKDLLTEARNMALQREEGKTVIYNSVGQDWRPFGTPKRIRPFESVILHEGISDHIYMDINEFLMNSNWYFDKGIPYRRGYLLHGPPGCGKTSFVMCLAGKLRYNICVLNVSDPLLTDDRLQYLLATVPPRAFILLEDVDGAIHKSDSFEKSAVCKYDDNEKDLGHKAILANPFGDRRATFSGLLNALDGVTATEQRIVFMTTNHIERLPMSLIRPGRVDLKVLIGYASPYQIRQMFLRFFPNEIQLGDEFGCILSDMKISMAELQGFFMFCKNSATTAVEMAIKWKEADKAAQKTYSIQIR